MLTIQCQQDVTTQVQPTERAMQIAVMFGLTLDGQNKHTIIPPIELTLMPGSAVFLTGVSGGGKSTLMRLIAESIGAGDPGFRDVRADPPALLRMDGLATLPDVPLVEALALPEVEPSPGLEEASLEQVCHWLSLAGLNDAAVMLRRPKELSEGQRHRLSIAQAIAVAHRRKESWSVLLADEFGSTLDRTTAFALARSLRKWVSNEPVCLVLATAHDDLLEPLAPDVLVEVSPGGRCSVHTRQALS